MLRQERELRSICSFYSRLGYARSPENTLLLSRLQFWRLLKDCNIHHHGITLTQIDRLIRGERDCSTTDTEWSSESIYRLFYPLSLCVFQRMLIQQRYTCLSRLCCFASSSAILSLWPTTSTVKTWCKGTCSYLYQKISQWNCLGCPLTTAAGIGKLNKISLFILKKTLFNRD